MAIVKDREGYEASDDGADQLSSIEDLTMQVSRSLAPFINPMIDALRSLQLGDIADREGVPIEYEL